MEQHKPQNMHLPTEFRSIASCLKVVRSKPRDSSAAASGVWGHVLPGKRLNWTLGNHFWGHILGVRLILPAEFWYLLHVCTVRWWLQVARNLAHVATIYGRCLQACCCSECFVLLSTYAMFLGNQNCNWLDCGRLDLDLVTHRFHVLT